MCHVFLDYLAASAQFKLKMHANNNKKRVNTDMTVSKYKKFQSNQELH